MQNFIIVTVLINNWYLELCKNNPPILRSSPAFLDTTKKPPQGNYAKQLQKNSNNVTHADIELRHKQRNLQGKHA